MDVFFEIHCGLPQEGPGSDTATREALARIGPLPPLARILDIGCGPGRQTLILAEQTGGLVTAIDNHQPYLEELRGRAERKGLSQQMATTRCSMDRLPFEENCFDLIWAEGSIYIVGFGEGLRDWRRYLKTNGAMAVTELCWLVETPPEEARSFFCSAYPAMRTVAGNMDVIKRSGYAATTAFTLPESAWWEGYYAPLERRISELRLRYRDDAAVLRALDGEQAEIDLYRRHSDSYGYVFFIMRKSDEGPCTTI